MSKATYTWDDTTVSRKRTRTKRYNEKSRQAGRHTPNTGIYPKATLPSSYVCHHAPLMCPEPCSRLIVQNNEAIDPLGWLVDGAASIGDVVCRLFSTTVTAAVRRQSPALCSMFAPNLPTPVRSLLSRVQARRDRPTPCPLFDGVGMNLCSLVVVDPHDSAHLACVQCITVSCGGTEDTSC